MSTESQKVVVTCALTGVFTDPKTHPVPVTPDEMASAALEAYNAGASIVHCHFRNQAPDKGHLPTWNTQVVGEICAAIRAKAPELLINMSTGIVGEDISGPINCLKEIKPELAALNAGSLNYLKAKQDGSWAWDPILFDNPVEKIAAFLDVMKNNNIVPECECFDTGIVRSVGLMKKNKLFTDNPNISLVMGVASGMPAKPSWLPLLIDEMPELSHWQVIAIGRQEVWSLHEKCIQLGGHVRTGVEDTFYLPNGDKTNSNGQLIEALVNLVKQNSREVASPQETRKIFDIN